jgi:sugar lactone lactonase YvrE
MVFSKVLAVFALCLSSIGHIVLAVPSEEANPILYWVNSNDNAIVMSDQDGNNRHTILMDVPVDSPEGLAVDQSTGNLYWIRNVRFGIKSINRARLSGGDYRVLIDSGMDDPKRIAIDGEEGYVFWTDFGNNKVFRSDLDGSNVVELADELNLPLAVGVDTHNKMVYWSNADAIERMAYDGSNRETIVTRDDGIWSPRGLAIDSGNGRLFWIDAGVPSGDSFIYSSDLDGSDMQTVLSGISRSTALDLALDPVHNQIYYSSSASSPRGIYRVSYDGSGNGSFVTFGLGNTVVSLDYDPVSEYVSWTQSDNTGIFSANRNEGEIAFAIPRIYTPRRMIVDNERSLLYWSTTDGRIMRSSTDGTDVREVVGSQSLWAIHDLALDRTENVLYFAHEGQQDYRIVRIDAEGSDSEVIYQRDAWIIPTAIDLDTDNGYIYFSNRLSSTIHRIPFEGGEDETVLSGQQLNITELKIDHVAQKIYWVGGMGDDNVIKRANTDGTQDEVVHDDLVNAQSIALDIDGGYLYWSDENGAHRSNLDGSDRITIVDAIPVGPIELAFGSLPTYVDSDRGRGLPGKIELYQNYPNPFNPSTVIRYSLPELSYIRLEIFNVLGQSIMLLVDDIQEGGFYEVTWNAAQPSGMYIYRLEAVPVNGNAGPTVRTNRMLLLK